MQTRATALVGVARATADRLEGVLVDVEGGQDQDPGLGTVDDAAGRLDPVHPRHPHVHEDDISLHPGRQLDSGGAVVGLRSRFKGAAVGGDPLACSHQAVVGQTGRDSG